MAVAWKGKHATVLLMSLVKVVVSLPTDKAAYPFIPAELGNDRTPL
jgi:hypothetical protein